MKELSIEEKARAYDEAFERAEGMFKQGMMPERLEYIFPELQESDDEKIRKWLICTLKSLNNSPVQIDGAYKMMLPAIAWLEKQGEQKPYGQRKECYNCQFNYAGECKGSCPMKIGEQKPFDYENANIQQKDSELKVETRFKIGDWIIFAEGRYSIYQIERIDNYRYYLRHYLGGTLSVYFDNALIRHWTIQDAKPGDVLSTKWGAFIVKQCLNTPNRVTAYCGINSMGRFDNCDGIYPWTYEEITPATKEQRDLLFQKMKEAGYEWDTEKRELKKIEQKQVTDYPDSLRRDNWELIHEFVTKFGRIPEDEDELNVLIEYVLKRQMSAKWSEEDEAYKLFVISAIEYYYDEKNPLRKDLVDWLKSLRPQNKWKPSEEQMDALSNALSLAKSCGEESSYDLRILYEQLKELKEE